MSSRSAPWTSHQYQKADVVGLASEPEIGSYSLRTDFADLVRDSLVGRRDHKAFAQEPHTLVERLAEHSGRIGCTVDSLAILVGTLLAIRMEADGRLVEGQAAVTAELQAVSRVLAVVSERSPDSAVHW